jgi:hypothetical protein
MGKPKAPEVVITDCGGSLRKMQNFKRLKILISKRNRRFRNQQEIPIKI